jgi:DNA repair protein RecO (recombination protein O)
MQAINTQGIILTRTDFGEADRILHFLTPDRGKVSGIAKGVRKSKSKLAGGIELFSISELSFIVGKSDIYTIISARLVKHFDNIVKELDRTSTTYEAIRMLNKATEDSPEPAYFNILQSGF